MALHLIDKQVYRGMGPQFAPGELPLDLAQEVVAYTPSRQGQMCLAPVLKLIQTRLGLPLLHGHAVWHSLSGQADRLLVFYNTQIWTVSLFGAWKLDERDGKPHSYYQIPAPTLLSSTAPDASYGGVTSVQFQTELILSIGLGFLMRYYIAGDGTGAETLYALGQNTPAQPTAAGDTGGSMTGSGAYSYRICYEDELGRESSPGTARAVTLTAGQSAVNLSLSIAVTLTGGETHWNIYRLNPGASKYLYVAQVDIGTSTYKDTASDDTVNRNRSCPQPGENDPPGVLGPGYTALSQALCVWHDRLVINDEYAPDQVQVSNAGSPTQFSSLPLPTSLMDGTRFSIMGHGQNVVTGLASLGSLLAIFGRNATTLFYGDDISTFQQRPVHERGCSNPGGVQRCDNVILFPSDDGVYALGYEDGYTMTKVSQPVDNLFQGFTETARPDIPTSQGGFAAVQVANAMAHAMTSFYCNQRYYLSFGNRTLCYDLQAQGWTDTGWGFIRSAVRYMAQEDTLTGSAPETVFLSLADQYSYSEVLHYFTAVDTPDDVDAPDRVMARIVTRPFDPSGQPHQHAKRVHHLAVYGTSSAKRGTIIGSCTWYGDGTALRTQQIRCGVTWKHRSALFELAPPPYTGELVWADLRLTMNDLTLHSIEAELSYVN